MHPSAPRRPNRFEIDLGAITHNIGEVRRIVGHTKRIIAALKADGYGFGLAAAAEALQTGGVDGIAVADLSDAATMRDCGIDLPVLMYAGNLIDAQAVAAVESLDLMPTIVDREGAQALSSLSTRSIRVFVKVDVGLERLGVPSGQAIALIRHVRTLPNLELFGLYTHLDVPEHPRAKEYVSWQLDRYLRLCGNLAEQGIEIPIRMVASSAVLRLTLDMNLEAVDPGHILFGLTPPGPVGVEFDLRSPFVSLSSRLIQVKTLDRDGFRDLAPIPLRRDMRIGVIPFGLRDGAASLTCGEVLIRGRRAPIVGAFSLEHTRVDLTDAGDVRVGDEVMIIGEQQGAVISPEEVIKRCGLSMKPEIAMAVRASVERCYR